MNLENVKVNNTYKNYKALCEILNEPIKTGKSKQIQLKDWERYFQHKKKGNSFIITKIFDIPNEKIDNRKGKHNDNRKNNGGNNTSIIADYMHNYIVERIEDDFCIEGTKNSIIKQMGFYCDDFNDCFYNFDEIFQKTINDKEVPYKAIEKKFYYDYMAKVSCSYTSRLKRVLDNFSDALIIVKFYRTCKPAISTYGKEYMETTDYNDKETIDKIKTAEKDTRFLYGVTESSQLWKIYGDTETYNKYHADFIKNIKTLLKDEEIVNCYEVLNIVYNNELDSDFQIKVDEETCEFDWEKLNTAQSKLAHDKIETTFKLPKSIYDPYHNEWTKISKYNKNDISDDMINDCIDMINVSIGTNVNPETGEISYGECVEDKAEWISDEMVDMLNHTGTEYKKKCS